VLLLALDAPDGAPDAIPGLGGLLETHEIKHVEGWVRQLLEHGDALGALAAGAMPAAERSLVVFADRVRAMMATRLKADASMDFDRMITWTRDLIRDDLSVRRALQRRIRVLVVDEFQDVDPAQREIAWLLGEPETKRADTTRLVFVGDPKQSIYRFRRADVRVWRGVERDFSERGLGRVLALSENRRSVPGVLGLVDHLLGPLLDRPTDTQALRDFEVAYAPVTPVRAEHAWPHSVEVLAVPLDANGDAPSADTVRRSEAVAVAQRALELHASGVAWREMAVLLAGWGAVDLYQAALEAAGVPTYVLRAGGFYDRSEVLDLVVALQAIRDPLDDRALCGFLRGPCVGVSDETLLRVARALRSQYWTRLASVEIPDAGERARLARGAAMLERLVALRDRIPVRALVERLIDESGYLAHLALLHGVTSQPVANVRKLLHQLGGMRDADVGDVLEAVAEGRGHDDLEGDARLYGESDDVVTITSVHMAKGLEWRVVFWSDLVREVVVEKGTMMVSGSEVALKPEDGQTSVEFTRLRNLAVHERDAESKRLWYVAATRAKDLLVLGGVPVQWSRAQTSPATAIRGCLPDLGVAGGVVTYTARGGKEFTAKVRTVAIVEEDVERPPREIGDPIALAAPHAAIVVPAPRTRHSATELMTLERCGLRHWFKYVAGIREESVARPVDAGALTPIQRGLIVHDVVSRYKEDVELQALLEDAIGRFDDDAPPPESAQGFGYRVSLRTEVESVLAHPEFRPILDRPGAERELAFLHLRAPGTYLDGRIDLVAPGSDGYDVIDLKTGEITSEATAARAAQYDTQRAVYVDAIEAITGRAVSSFRFHFSQPAVQVGGPIDAESHVELDERLDRTVASLAADPPPLTTNPWECRYCGFKAVGWCPGI
jgi:ATP-dependent helicase/nuclease subunit A